MNYKSDTLYRRLSVTPAQKRAIKLSARGVCYFGRLQKSHHVRPTAAYGAMQEPVREGFSRDWLGATLDLQPCKLLCGRISALQNSSVLLAESPKKMEADCLAPLHVIHLCCLH